MDKTKKKNARRYVLWGCLAALVLALALLPLMARQKAPADGPTASILSAQAKTGSVRAAVHGGGTLEAGDDEKVELPKDVKITEFLVKNGDMVSEGDALAAVDKVSVMTAITEIRDSMSLLETQMEAVRDESGDTTVTAAAGGRVKAVYGEKGDRVESVLLEHGALAVLSLDSKMSVTLTADTAFATGDSVKVTLADGKAVNGKVESNLAGTLIVTIEDKGYDVGQSVSVEGAGEGKLEIHSPWAAAAFAGEISAVRVKEEQTVSSGATLFNLTDTDYTAQLELMAETHRDYEELLQKLFKMYDSGVIAAPCDGMISGIDEDSAHLLAAEEEEYEVQLLADQGENWQIVLLSSITPTCTNDDSCPLDPKDPGHIKGCPKAACVNADSEGVCKAATHNADCIEACTEASTPEGCTANKHKTDCIHSCTSAKDEKDCPGTKYHYNSCIKSCIESDGSVDCPAVAGRHKPGCIEACTHADVKGSCDATDHHYLDCIESCINSSSAGEKCPATKHVASCYYADVKYYARIGKVSDGEDLLVMLWDPTPSYEVNKTDTGWELVNGTVNESLFIDKSGEPLENTGGFAKGDIIFVITGYKPDGTEVPVGPVLYRKAQQIPEFTMPSFNFNFNFTIPGMTGMTGSTETTLYDLNQDVLMVVTPQDTMTVTISVDEQDISSVQTGMAAELTVNALPGEEFEGEVTKVSKSGTNSGGSSKFAVEITLPRQSEMLAGMSASAVLPLYEKMDVLTLPAAALNDLGGKTVVYTALDKKTGEPSNPVEVECGISDGETVEILSGLASGDTVYYSYYDSLEESDAVETAGRFDIG